MTRIYLDHAATTWPDPQVIDAMKKFREQHLGNASSIHRLGVKAATELELARNTVAAALRANPEEVLFTSSGTESNNFALKGFCLANRYRGDHLIVSAIEHPSILETARWLSNQGFRVSYLPVDSQGLVNPADLRSEISDGTILVSIMHANNEVGSIQDLKALGAICSERKVAFHTDACQSFSKIEIDVRELGLDLMTISSHKIHGPTGVAALYVRKGTALEPLLHGGGQEGSLRPGTYNTEGIVGFAAAIRIRDPLDAERMGSLRDRAISAILKAIPGAELNGPNGMKRLCNNISFSFPGTDAKQVLFDLDKRGICVSVGSACASGKKVASHVLTAMATKKKDDQASESIRISLSKWTTQEEIDALVAALISILKNERPSDVAARA